MSNREEYVDTRKNENSTKVFVDEKGISQIRVSGGSSIVETAGCVLRCLESGGKVQLRAMGASAVNQMYKSMATVCIMLEKNGIKASFYPAYDEAEVWDEKEQKTIKKTIMVGYLNTEKESESNVDNNETI